MRASNVRGTVASRTSYNPVAPYDNWISHLDGKEPGARSLVRGIGPSLGFKEHPHSHGRPYDFKICPTVFRTDKGLAYAIRTSSSVELFDDFEKNGLGFNGDDQKITGWLRGAGLLEAVEKAGDRGIFLRGPEEKSSYSSIDPSMTDVDRYMRPIIIDGEVDMNSVGRRSTEADISENKFRSYFYGKDTIVRPNYIPEMDGYVPFTEKSINWMKTLVSNGIDRYRELKGIGAGDLSQESAAAVTLYREYIALSDDISRIAWQIAYAKGYSGKEAQEFVDDYVYAVIEHELYHMLEPKRTSKRFSERRIGNIHADDYAKLAELHKGTLRGTIYASLSEHFEAYAAKYSGLSGLKESMSKLEAIANEAMEEAERLGLDEEEALAYVEGKISKHEEGEKDKGEDLESMVEEELKAVNDAESGENLVADAEVADSGAES